MSGTDTTYDNARRPQEGPEHVVKDAHGACFDRVSGAQWNVDIMNARCRIPGAKQKSETRGQRLSLCADH